MIDAAFEIIVAVLIVLGAFVCLVASIGLLRLPDIYSRTHAASKAGTVGSALALVALAIHAGTLGESTRAIAAVVFFVLTAPLSAHLLGKAAHDMGYPLWKGSVRDDRAKYSDNKATSDESDPT